MDTLTREEEISLLLLRSSIKAKRGLMHLAEEHELNIMQALTICLLEPNASVPMHSISKMLVCDASNVTGIVDKLVGNKYITREESQTDRRVHTITLTKKGRSLREKCMQQIHKNHMSTIAKLSEKEKETLRTLLETILR